MALIRFGGAAAASVWLAACSGAPRGPADAGTSPGDAGPPALAQHCREARPPATAPELLPMPAQVLAWEAEEAFAPETLRAHGASPAEEEELRELAQQKGLDFVAAAAPGGGLRVRLHDPSEWDLLVSTCGVAPPVRAGAYYLVTASAQGEASVDLLASDEDGRLHGLKTLKQLVRPGPTCRWSPSSSSGRRCSPAMGMRARWACAC